MNITEDRICDVEDKAESIPEDKNTEIENIRKKFSPDRQNTVQKTKKITTEVILVEENIPN